MIVRAYGLTESDVPAYIADFENALKQLKPGFTGVTDVTGSPTVLSPEVAGMLAPTGDRAIEAGVGGWVYVADSPVWKNANEKDCSANSPCITLHIKKPMLT
ncbi:hypothetical protein ACFSQ7_17640 [Paenibacillus rhizoplanae]